MKKLILGLCTLLFISCQNNIITEHDGNSVQVYVITNITKAGSGDTVTCRYLASTNQDYIYYRNNISFCDTIGKYKIGDKVTAKFVKQ